MDKGDFSWQDDAGERHTFDAVFEMVHGTPGEDGRLSAYFELIGLPYTASQPRTLAIGHHKAWTTALLARLGHPVAKAGIFRKTFWADWRPSKRSWLKSMDCPVSSKPVRAVRASE